MYRLIVETLLGVQLQRGLELRLAPSLPPDWETYRVHYRHHNTTWHITVSRGDGAPGTLRATVDGHALDTTGAHCTIALHDDGGEHAVELTLA